MTSLRNFQNEINDIQSKEVAKQRAQALALADKEKENKNPADEVATISNGKKPVVEDQLEDEGKLQVSI